MKSQKIFDHPITFFFRRIDLFRTLWRIAWGLFFVALPLFIDYDHLVVEIPWPVVVFGCLVIAGASVAIWFHYRQDRDDRKNILLYNFWNYMLPVAISVLLMGLDEFTEIYDYSGVFFGGLGGLLIRMFAIFCAAVGASCYWIARWIVKRRRERGLSPKWDPERFWDVINLVFGTLGALALVITGIVFVVDELEYRRMEARQQAYYAYRDEMLGKLNSGGENMDPDADAKFYAYCAITMAEGNLSEADLGDTQEVSGFNGTCASREVLLKGRDEVKEMEKEFIICSDPFDAFSGSMYYYPRERVARDFVYVEVEEKGTREKNIRYIVVVFDESWHVTDMYVSDRLDSSWY